MIIYLVAFVAFTIAGSSAVKKGQMPQRVYRVISVLLGIGAVVTAVLYVRAMP